MKKLKRGLMKMKGIMFEKEEGSGENEWEVLGVEGVKEEEGGMVGKGEDEEVVVGCKSRQGVFKEDCVLLLNLGLWVIVCFNDDD